MNISEHDKRLALLPHAMIQSSCGNIERRMYANDGRGSPPTLESSRLVVDTTQATSARVFVRPEVGAQRNVSFIAQEVARINGVGSFEENQGFISWLFLPAASSVLPELVEGASNTPCVDTALSQLSHANLLSARCYRLACLL